MEGYICNLRASDGDVCLPNDDFIRHVRYIHSSDLSFKEFHLKNQIKPIRML